MTKTLYHRVTGAKLISSIKQNMIPPPPKLMQPIARVPFHPHLGARGLIAFIDCLVCLERPCSSSAHGFDSVPRPLHGQLCPTRTVRPCIYHCGTPAAAQASQRIASPPQQSKRPLVHRGRFMQKFSDSVQISHMCHISLQVDLGTYDCSISLPAVQSAALSMSPPSASSQQLFLPSARDLYVCPPIDTIEA